MEAVILEEIPAGRTVEIEGKRYYEDQRGRFVPAEMVTSMRRITSGIIKLSGQDMMVDGSGRYTPLATVKAQDQLRDEMVRKIIAFSLDLSDQVTRFYAHTMRDIDNFDALLEQNYQVLARGNAGKGNRTYLTFDGLFKITVQIGDQIAFGPELQVAKTLVDECLNQWSETSGPELRTVITSAFDVDKEGKINRAAVLKLLRHDIADDRWRRAMDAIRDAVTVVARKEYIRFYERRSVKHSWRPITIDLAKAS